MILADTSAWIDYVRGIDSKAAAAVDSVLADGRIVLGDLILAELMRGMPSEKEVQRVWSVLEPLKCVLLGGRDIAMTAARHYRFLRAKGITMPGTIDLLIGTWCIENGVALIHSNRDYDGMQRHLGLMRFP